jgi:aminoglycoside phosphotransferase (APT) family kinase protein
LVCARGGQEFRVLRALSGGTIPVVPAAAPVRDDGVIGMFHLMSYVPGRIFWDPALPELV